MNAPITASQLAPATLKVLKLDQLSPSNTHVQALRRKRFDEGKLKELAESIGKVGILQPIVARPAAAAGAYEIVAGERRWLAARIAGLAEIAVNVTDLPDPMVLEVQLVENLQREGLHEMEEAEGYDELMKLRKLKPEEIGGLVGKSRSYVYGRIKLLALCPEARKAFYAGEIDGSKALLIARIGHHDTQRKALKDITNTADGHFGREPMSYREAHRHVLDNYMLKLKQAPFDPKDTALVPKAGACGPCPKRTGNQADLFTDVKDPDVCTDPKCFDDKRQAHYAGAVKKLEAAGKKVIHGDAAKKIFPDWDDESEYNRNRMAGGYKGMDQHDYIGNRYTTPAALLGKTYEPTLVQHPLTGKLVEVAAPADLAKAAKEKDTASRKRSSSGSRSTTGAQPKKKEPAAEDLINARLFDLIHAKSAALVSKEAMRLVACDLTHPLMDNTTPEETRHLEKLLGLGTGTLDYGSGKRFLKAIEGKSVAQLEQLCVFMFLSSEIAGSDSGKPPAEVQAVLAKLKIDPAAEFAKLEAELKQKAAPALAPPIAPKGKKPGAKTASFMAPHYATTAALQAVIGNVGISRTDVTKKIWAYIKKHGLQDKKVRRMINADEKLLPVFGGKKQISMFDMTKIIGKQLTTKISEVKAGQTPATGKKK